MAAGIRPEIVLPRRSVALLPAALCLLLSPPQADARDQLDPILRSLLIEAVETASSFDDRFEAEVWLTDMSRRLAGQVPATDERLQILRTVHFRASEAGLAPELVLAVIDVESDFDRFAISSASA